MVELRYASTIYFAEGIDRDIWSMLDWDYGGKLRCRQKNPTGHSLRRRRPLTGPLTPSRNWESGTSSIEVNSTRTSGPAVIGFFPYTTRSPRSEERRVGKECR